MITQAIMDFFRDLIVNWVSGMNTLTAGLNPGAAGAAIGGVAANAGHFLALFISSAVWGVLMSALGVWFAVWLVTGLVAIVSRRGKSE
jgi:hypothetical protein